MNNSNHNISCNETFNEIKNKIKTEQNIFKKPDAYKNINTSSFIKIIK